MFTVDDGATAIISLQQIQSPVQVFSQKRVASYLGARFWVQFWASPCESLPGPFSGYSG